MIYCFFLSCSVFLGFDAEVAKVDVWTLMDNSMNELKRLFSESARNHGHIYFIQRVKDFSLIAPIMLL